MAIHKGKPMKAGKRRRKRSSFPDKQGKPIKHLEEQGIYNTLDPLIPLDRCLMAAGYRSQNQFCKVNAVPPSLLCCWRKGRPHDPPQGEAPLAAEMANRRWGFSTYLWRIMKGTGCLEYELFPDVFTPDFYEGMLSKAAMPYSPAPPSSGDAGVERKERRLVVKSMLRALPALEREVIEYTFGLGPTREELTYSEIGDRLGFTGERVRQLINRAFRKLMMPSVAKRLAEVSPFPPRRFESRTPHDAMAELFRMKDLYPKIKPY